MNELFQQFKTDLSKVDSRAAFALVYAAVGLTCNFYLKNLDNASTVLGWLGLERSADLITTSSGNNLPSLAYWVGLVTTFYFVFPALAIKYCFRRSLSDHGLNFDIERDFWKLYAACAIVMVPLVYLMSQTAGFAAKYPFFKVYDNSPYLSTAFFAWEAIYFVQFFGLEFFFRGFLINSLKPAIGIYSIFAMMVPYCMIHFGKPPAETFAAIFAGIFLGWLAYRNGNIWLGLLLHCTVAFLMDIMALFNKGLL